MKIASYRTTSGNTPQVVETNTLHALDAIEETLLYDGFMIGLRYRSTALEC